MENHEEVWKTLPERIKHQIYCGDDELKEDRWEVADDDEGNLCLSTWMDNFDMESFFRYLKIPKEAIIEERY